MFVLQVRVIDKHEPLLLVGLPSAAIVGCSVVGLTFLSVGYVIKLAVDDLKSLRLVEQANVVEEKQPDDMQETPPSILDISLEVSSLPRSSHEDSPRALRLSGDDNAEEADQDKLSAEA